MTTHRLHADAVHGQSAGADRHARFTQAPVVPIEALEAARLGIDGDDGEREFDDLIVTRGAGGFGIQESDLHGGQGPMLGLVPRSAGDDRPAATPRKGHEVRIMNKWFYAKDGQAIGPLSTPEMHELIGQGACSRTTLVWTRGMRDWLPACMAAWMWEERTERRDVTNAGDGASNGASEGGVATMVSTEEAPAVPSESHADARTSGGASTRTAGDGTQGSTTESPDAGVVGMVRKLFGLG